MALTAPQIIASFDAAGITTPDQLTTILTKLRLEGDIATLTRQGGNARAKLGAVIADLEADRQAIEAQLAALAGEPKP